MVYLRTLLGAKNLDFSIKCLKSCIENCLQNTTLQIFEDGSITEQLADHIKEQIPNSEIIYAVQRDKLLKDKLQSYPQCYVFRNSNLYGYKFFDVMLYDTTSFFYIDSDIFFFKKFNFPETGNSPVFMKDSENSYCFSNKKIKLIKSKLLKKINAGFYYFPFTKFNLSKIEKILTNNYSKETYSHPWSEQTLWSILSCYTQPVFYFNPEQIVMASPLIKINKNLIAIHFSRPYRTKVNLIKKRIKRKNYSDGEKKIQLIKCKSDFSYSSFLIEKYFNKFLRRITAVPKSFS